MQDAPVLHVAALADHDGVTVCAEHGRVPHARVRADGYAPDEHGTGGDEGGSGDIGAVPAERDEGRYAGTGAGHRLAAHSLDRPITSRGATIGMSQVPAWITRAMLRIISTSLISPTMGHGAPLVAGLTGELALARQAGPGCAPAPFFRHHRLRPADDLRSRPG